MKKIADNHQKNSHLDNFLHFHHFLGDTLGGQIRDRLVPNKPKQAYSKPQNRNPYKHNKAAENQRLC